MNMFNPWAAAWHVFGALAVQITIVVVMAACLQPRTKSALWRRTFWQVCLLSLAVLVACELTGVVGRIASRLEAVMQLKRDSSPLVASKGQ
jgi:hypothetical protein